MTALPAEHVALSEPRAARTPKRHSLPYIIREVWGARELVMQFVQRDIKIRYAQALFGFLWALLMPVLIVCSGLVFRLVISSLSGQPLENSSIASLAVKSLPWAFFSSAISIATQSIISYSGLIGKVYFPREALPLSAVIAQLFDFVIGAAAIFVLLVVVGVTPHMTAFWSLPLLTLFLMFTTGMALLLSCANLFFRDVKYIVQVMLNFGVFATPIFFEPYMLGERGSRVMMALPLSPFIEGLNVSIVQGHSLLETVYHETAKGAVLGWSPWYLLYAATSATLTLLVGAWTFRHFSGKFAEMA